MTIESALYNELTNKNSGVKALISTRMYPESAPQDVTLPYLVYQRISTPPNYTHDGDSTLQFPRFQIMGVASTASGARALAVAVRAALSGKTGSLGDGSVSVQGIFIANETSNFDDDTEYYEFMMDIIPYYR